MAPIEVEKQRESAEAKQEAPQGVDTPLGVEDIASELEAAVGLGKVAEASESAGENKGAGAAQSKTTGKTAQEIEEQRKMLLNLQPPKKDMVREIRQALHQQLTNLGKEEAKLKKQGLQTIMQYNDVVKRMREINRLLAEVAQAGYKVLKALWLRIVHGIV